MIHKVFKLNEVRARFTRFILPEILINNVGIFIYFFNNTSNKKF